jgi:hypothetical protein
MQAIGDLRSPVASKDAKFFLLSNEALEDLTFWCDVARVPVHKVQAKARMEAA